MNIDSMEGEDTIGTSRMYSPLFEVMKAKVKNDRQTLAEEQAKKQIQEIVVEEQAEEQKKKVMVEEAGVEWEVETESASDIFAEHEDVQCDNVECQDIDVQALEDDSEH
ncbi:hypothetical protein HD554DRAFT_2036700 [Boletus coccyginus]|nr:hypothetical protein HD554DRAFT_2036700 [Boletus coccyginus]